ncbi:MAG: zinc ribbon domain-containing protein [Pseudomonadota bacterium]
MPIYEYRCEKCSHVFEKLVFSGELETVRCPHCSSDQVKKLMSACSFMGTSIGTCASGQPKGFS